LAFYELRQYKIHPEKMDAWIEFMENEILPFQIAKGMVVTGSYRGEGDDSVYIWMRRFENEPQREELYDEVYESTHWKETISPRLSEFIDRSAVQVTRIIPTPKSVAQ
jgi:hypothetical protein